MRFCNMRRRTGVRIAFGHLENEIHFQRQPRARARVEYNQISFMSTMAEVGTTNSHRSPVARLVRWIALSILLILAGGLLYAWFVAHSALPQLDGRLRVAGLSAMVTVTRDAQGVPTIEAATLD